VVDKPAQKKIQLLFQNYLAGMSLSKAAEKAGIHIPHGMVVKLLSNQHYIGDSFYPQLIDKSTFEKAAVARRHRAQKLGEDKPEKAHSPENGAHSFHACENRRILRRACAAGRVSLV